MHNEAQFVALKVNAIIAHTKSVQNASCALQFPELVQFGVHYLLRQTAKLAKNLQLQLLGHTRQFSRAGRIENNLEWTHSPVAETRLVYAVKQASPKGLLLTGIFDDWWMVTIRSMARQRSPWLPSFP